MNFFEQQDHARRQSRILIILFLLAVVAIVLAVNATAALLWRWTHGGGNVGAALYPHGFFVANTLITVGLIAGGTLFQIFNLRDGGDAVARMAGGRLVSQSTSDSQERRLLNVVAEMALASGVACPKTYVLDRETSINAFAAGYHPNQAVVAVTRGTLSRLSRDELQGVVAHEFSHILNGDMRLNVRLIGLLFGIEMIAGFGRVLTDIGWYSRSCTDEEDKPASRRDFLYALGKMLVIIGFIGVFFGRLIKAAVSRQREFLADASAVRFTRNPDGIGGTLRKIGGLARDGGPGSRIEHPNAEQLAHLFLGAPHAGELFGLLATHPTIRERLRRIYGRSVELLDAPELQIPEQPAEGLAAPLSSGFAAAAAAPAPASGARAEAAQSFLAGASAAWGRRVIEQLRLQPEIDSALQDPHAACALLYALLFEPKPAEPQASADWYAILGAHAPAQAALVPPLVAAVGRLPAAARLPLADLAMPAVRQLSAQEREDLLRNVGRLIAADHRITLAEFVLQTLLERRLAPRAGRATPVKFADLAQLRQESALLLSLVAAVATLDSSGVRESAAPAPRSGRNGLALARFVCGVSACPGLALTPSDFVPPPAITFAAVRTALARANRLAPLAKPGLIKAMLAAAERDGVTLAVADALRAICASLEAPMPPAVAQVYAEYGFVVE